MAEIIQTIQDMESVYYSRAGVAFLEESDLKTPFMNKDAPVISTTTGVYNAVYGAQAWVQLNMEANTLGIMPKAPWNISGNRAITARSTTLPYGGRAESGALPATIKPTFAEVTTKPKIIANTFQVGEIQEYLADKSGDDAYGKMVDMRNYMAVEHKEDMNTQLNTENGTTANYNIESIDRVCGSYAELTNCKENDESTSYTPGDLDIYALDRDGGASWSDAYVNYNSTSGAVRQLTDGLLNTLQYNTLQNGANKKGQVFQTGYDTWSTINQLYDTQVRYNIVGSAYVQPGVNGIQTMAGSDVGLQVATLFQTPIIESKDTTVDTGGISRLYLLDLSNPEGFELPRMCMKIAKPTQYFQAGINQGTPFAIDSFSDKGMYRTMGELYCTFFKVQGKLRDLKA